MSEDEILEFSYRNPNQKYDNLGFLNKYNNLGFPSDDMNALQQTADGAWNLDMVSSTIFVQDEKVMVNISAGTHQYFYPSLKSDIADWKSKIRNAENALKKAYEERFDNECNNEG